MVGAQGWIPLAEEVQVLQLVSVEIARNVDDLTAHNHHLPAQHYLLGHYGLQVVQEMASTVQHQHLPLPLGKLCAPIYTLGNCIIQITKVFNFVRIFKGK